MTRIVAISDTHRLHGSVDIPDGDVLVHAGDFCNRGELREVPGFLLWLDALPHPHKVLIAGNHDECFQKQPHDVAHMLTHACTVTYLQDSGCEIGGLSFFGSPWQPEFFDWAFNLPRGEALARKWRQIPTSTDVLITHGPPRGVLDVSSRGEACGCDDLLEAVEEKRPRVHIFGHIHEGHGWTRRGETLFVNASSCTAAYRPTNKPIVIDVPMVGDAVVVEGEGARA